MRCTSRASMKGCLGLLVVFALLAWPIEQLQQLFGWSDSQTGDLLLVAVALLAIGAFVRGRADRRRAPETTLRGSRLASGLRQAAAARLGEAWRRALRWHGPGTGSRRRRACRRGRTSAPATSQ